MFAVGLVVAAMVGVVPLAVSNIFYDLENNFIFHSRVVPSLQKYEGHWVVAIKGIESTSDATPCLGYDGTIFTHNGIFTGKIGVLASQLVLDATATTDGLLTGAMTFDTTHTGTLEGSVLGTTSTGTWKDTLGCMGVFTFTKVEPVVDPIKGHVVTYRGNPTLTRDGVTTPLRVDEILYEGDTIEAQDGSSALLAMGPNGDDVTVGFGTRYTVTKGK